MATQTFAAEFDSRGTVKTTDKLMIHNIDTGATEYTTVADLLASLAIYGPVTTAGQIINGDAGGTTTYEVFKVNGTNIGIIGSDGGAIYGDANVADIGVYVYGNNKFVISTNGVRRIIVGGVGTPLQVVGLPEYNDNANASASGLPAGAFYRTGDVLKVVH